MALNIAQSEAPGVKSGHDAASSMSALPPKADIAERQLDVRFVPKADIRGFSYSMISSAWAERFGGTSMPSALPVLRLMTNSNLADCTTGKSAGFSPLRILPA
jgi:hypothetical protein